MSTGTPGTPVASRISEPRNTAQERGGLKEACESGVARVDPILEMSGLNYEHLIAYRHGTYRKEPSYRLDVSLDGVHDYHRWPARIAHRRSSAVVCNGVFARRGDVLDLGTERRRRMAEDHVRPQSDQGCRWSCNGAPGTAIGGSSLPKLSTHSQDYEGSIPPRLTSTRIKDES